MRILVVSDLHYRLPHYDWLVEAADGRRRRGGGRRPGRRGQPGAHEVQTVVVLDRYLGGSPSGRPCSRPRATTTSTVPGAHGEQVARVAATAATRVGAARRRQSVDVGDTRFTVCPWWDGPVNPRRGRRTAGRGGGGPPGAVGLALPRAPGRHAAVPRRSPYVPRPGARRLDRASTSPTSCSAATSTRRRGPTVARGTPGSGRPGSSTPASRSARCRRTSPSTPRRGRRTGSACSESETSACLSRRAARRGHAWSALGVAGRAGRAGAALVVDERGRGSRRPCRGGPPRRRTAA